MQKDCLSTCVLRQSLMDIKGAPANHFFQLPDGYPLSRYFLILFLCSLQQLPNLTFSFSVISDLDQSNRTVILLMNSFTLIATCFHYHGSSVAVRFPHFYGGSSRLVGLSCIPWSLFIFYHPHHQCQVVLHIFFINSL